VDIDRELRTLAAAARPRAVLTLVGGIAVGATFLVYLGVLAWALTKVMSLPLFAFALGAVPLAAGIRIAGGAVARLRALSTIAARPERVIAAELAFRFGKPAVRICLDDSRAVVIVSGELDVSRLDRAIRARADAAEREPAGPYR
jgi:hypothetical protein